MKINFLTLFPRYFEPLINESIIKKAVDKKILEFNVVDFRDFTKSKHRKVDDEIYGGGHGLLLQVEPIDLALDSLENRGGYKILVTPQGKIFDQKMANKLAKYDQITLISGRYEGFDERVTYLVDEEISIGDYVLTGGELPAMVIADSICRLVPGVIKKESVENDSFQNEGLLDYPQYTRPREYKNMKVPEVLFNGNHKEISEWKLKAQLEKTKKNRPDILERIKNEK
ncbi:tRNA (guanosine(37)-N1)-methyltransferase TrmD [Mycoplasmopsis synoviae]|uniref:tRNA (guanine-N(1)-)-methyltransferase n=2 Tax=Mycoplasmopsis synoviae TaxID=2109 RepID=TRMD_MYCS5|nr:tRNA (guanosine(37)-N1)-methyltransferase TrmD [Mycoplasmopsis synoviae]Q4A738.2 RecName: Full=tRNA (guanine-N(1)-)-methyltransferase; AltName: Full=M1G-methyltransferase; AltName: Full=tRNA [GM37] methyltransferase [Mycoplasmopsis synoviae 53]AAZ43433.2 tRNA (guanine-N1)-methyltransferase [Mycoplasmopsis synoviae 53]AKB10798.1 tRNA (guanine-N1)-methyltransferase [Mycoplasmopsis synoviae ATCC 25204]AQU48267.1 tRNA (Guanine37-N1) -methyltransferase [Mycoplasmopsis synoviae]MBD5788490.1 tRNA 